MREILFRGKRIFDGKWVNGFAYKQYSAAKVEEWYIRAFETDFLVIPETVSQFTGLTDKNGRKIFEGDIIKWHDNPLISVRNQISEVCFGEYHDADSAFEDDKALGFYIRLKDGSCISICALNEFSNDFEIIGNIYDNPELLEGS